MPPKTRMTAGRVRLEMERRQEKNGLGFEPPRERKLVPIAERVNRDLSRGAPADGERG